MQLNRSPLTGTSLDPSLLTYEWYAYGIVGYRDMFFFIFHHVRISHSHNDNKRYVLMVCL